MHFVTEYLRATKQNWVKSLTLKALAAHPLFCYRFSMTSTSSKVGIKKWWTNCFAFETNNLSLIVLNWMLTHGNQANFWACAWPIRWWFVYSHFHTAILRLLQTFILQRKHQNLLIELRELFYHSYFDKQGLNFTRFAS